MKFSEIAQQIGITAQSSLNNFPARDPEIIGVAAVQEAPANTLSYIEGAKFAPYLATTKASALILPQDARLQGKANEHGLAWLSVTNPRLGFARAIALFYRPFRLAPGIHPTAVIDPSAQIGEQVAIGAYVVIEAGAKIGSGVCIHPNVVIYPQAVVGDRTVLHANCVIHERAQIGADCVIHSGAAIGSEGFGFVPTAAGWEKMEQSGVTILEDGVEVGCNTAIDRPAVGETRIKRQNKLDNLVHVAHGCELGEASALAAQTGLAGKVTLGKRVILAGQVGISDGVTLGDGVVATAQAGLHRDISSGKIVSGSPAVDNALYLKSSAIYKRLPELYRTLRELQQQMAVMEADIARLTEHL